MNLFERAIRLEPYDEGFTAVVPEGWATGRGAFGGLVLGYLVKAMDVTDAKEPATGGSARRLRSFSGDVLAAVLPGPVTLRVRTLRRGKHQSNLQATLEQKGQVVATGSGLFSGVRPVPMAPFAMAPPEFGDLPPMPFSPPAGDHFSALYELRTRCHQPFTRVGEPLVEAYVSEQGERERPLDAAAVTALLDAWWPVMLQTFDQPRAVATVAFTAQYFLDPATLTGSRPRFALKAQAMAGRDGFILEHRELWSGDQLVATNQQTIALLG